MAMTAYLQLKGKSSGEITGDCVQKGHEEWVTVYAMDHEVEIPRDTHTGLATGQRIHHPLTVTTGMGKHSPQSNQLCCTGEHCEVTIEFMRINDQGKEEKYYSIKLENAIIVNTRTYFPETFLEDNKPFQHMMDISFTYERIVWSELINSKEAEDNWKSPAQ